MKMRYLAVAAALAVAWGAQPEPAQSVAEQLQKGIYAQKTEGDLDSAIRIYRQIIASNPAQRVYAAQAQTLLAQALAQKDNNAGLPHVTASQRGYVPGWIKPPLSFAPSVRAQAGLAYDAATHSTVLFGGGNARLPDTVVYGDTWIWHGGWTQISPANSPDARTCPGMAYDPATGTVVLFGGQNTAGVVFGDTWTWDGVTWTQQFPAVSPPARSALQSMAYNPATETVVLFGGGGDQNDDYGEPVFGDTWEWHGRTKTWTQRFPLSSPSPRVTQLAYDAITKTVVLFAGDNGGGDCCRIYDGDTWTWDGLNWTQQSPAVSPSARTAPSMAYDARIGQVIVFGGTSDPPQGLNDTWAWDGKTWKQLSATQPTGLWIASMIFDPLSHGLVLFGGELTGDIVSNNTWLLVPVHSQ